MNEPTARNREIIVNTLPEGSLTQDHFEMRAGAMPIAGEGEAVIRTILMSIDAANRAWMQGATYREPILAGDAMHTFSIGEVVTSNDARLSPGMIVAAEGRWADHAVIRARHAQIIGDHRPLSHHLSVLGIAGKTAYHGLVDVGRPLAGETVLVSAAAGSVGMYVGQIAKALGCHVVGIAGGARKCAWVVEELGFDACVDHRAPGFFKAVRAACPKGVDVYFDNVGGKILETALFIMNEKGRIVCCGAVSQYDNAAPSGPRNLPGMVVVKRLRMEGFIVMDFADQAADVEAKLSQWVNEGAIRVVDDIVDGLENAPAALIGLLAGENRGKRMVQVSPE